MGMDQELEDLETRITECMNEQPKMPLARPSDIKKQSFWQFDEVCQLSPEQKTQFWNYVKKLAKFDGWDAGKALHIVYMAIFAGAAVHSAKRDGVLEPSYSPVNQIMEFVQMLPVTLERLQGNERSAYLNRLHESCAILHSDKSPGFSNPMAYISKLLNIK